MRRLVCGLSLAAALSAAIVSADAPKRYVLKDDAKFDELCFNSDEKPEETCLSIARLKAAALVSQAESSTPFERGQVAHAALLTEFGQVRTELQDCAATRTGYRSQAAAGPQEALSQQITALERGLVVALGGDYDKGDRLNWSTRKLIKKE